MKGNTPLIRFISTGLNLGIFNLTDKCLFFQVFFNRVYESRFYRFLKV